MDRAAESLSHRSSGVLVLSLMADTNMVSKHTRSHASSNYLPPRDRAHPSQARRLPP